MNNFFQDILFDQEIRTGAADVQTVLLVLALAFCLGHIVSWIYMGTHSGLSYSQTFTASLTLIPVLVALVMMLMSGNIYVAFGLMAVFAIVRFRNVLKDTRDTSFILWSIITGMAVGTMKFGIAISGCLFIALVAIYLRLSSLGARQRYDVVLSLHLAGDASAVTSIQPVLKRHSSRIQLASQRSLAENMLDLSYRLLLRDPARSNELLDELESTSGVAHVSLYHREDESEM
jgi:hypothetical protein